MDDKVLRIDKFIWAVRFYKTRSIAVDAVKRGLVMVNGSPIKSSRAIKVGDVVQIKQTPIFRHFKVLQLLGNRVGAPLVNLYVEDITPSEMLQLLEATKLANALNRRRGLGRPTKKERRDLDSFTDSGDDGIDDLDEDFDY